ncbi:MAG TPA: DUF4097 family beta strand repeat-containing protein [Gemmatimonadaceae bacterium]
MVRRLTIAALGMLVAAAPLAAQNEGFRDDDEFRSRIDTTVSLARDGTVDLSLVSGTIRVTSWDRDQVKVSATSERGILRFDASPSRVTLAVRSEHGELGDTRYEVTIPATARVISRSVSGDIDSRGGSEVEAHSVSGDITLADASGRARIETVSGTVNARHVGGGLRVDAVSGDLTLADITGDVDVQTVSGEIELAGVRSSYVHTETVSGDTRFAGTLDPKGRYDFHSHSGDIRIAIPAVGAAFDVETFSGDVDSDYPMTLSPGGGHDGKRMEFTINGGGARVTAETFSGDVTIERASGARRED